MSEEKKAFRLEVDGSNIAWLTFDYPEEKVNKFSQFVLRELSTVLDEVQANSNIQCLVIQSAKKGIYIAGADVKEILGYFEDTSDAEVEPLVRKMVKGGVDTFNKLENLHCPSIAVIHGACMGGGLEMALACTYRIAIDDKKTSMALPETQLGIIPGWGGTQRLPKLVGLDQAMPMILGGSRKDARKAKKIKLVDEVILPEFKEEGVNKFIAKILNPESAKKVRKARIRKDLMHKISSTPPGKMYAFHLAEKGVMQKTNGKYPAPLAAIDLLKETYGKSLKSGLARETEAFIKLTTKHTDIVKSLVNLFFVMEEVKKDPQVDEKVAKAVGDLKLDKAAVLGAGVMGGLISWLFSYRDVPVRVKDINWDAVSKGFGAAAEIYAGRVKRRRMAKSEANLKMHQITGTTDYSGFQDADIVVEAIVENMQVKKTVLAELEDHISKDAIIASNTSALSITEMQKDLKHPERFVGMHFFNPVNMMPLVEVIPGEKTSQETVAKMVAIVKKLGKTPVVVGDGAGFVVNRILIPSMNEGLTMLTEGIDMERIDKAITHFGMPMGPFVLADEVGLDVASKVAHILEEAFGERMKSPSFVDQMVERGMLGKKVGKGFFIHQGKNRSVNEKAKALLPNSAAKHGAPISSDEIIARFVLVMLNEATRCMEEKIIENPAYLDLAMITGTGFPPFRGGLLRYADAVGLKKIQEKMLELEKKYGARFKPTELINKLAQEDGKFYQ